MIALLEIRLARTMENKAFKVTQAEGEKSRIQKAKRKQTCIYND